MSIQDATELAIVGTKLFVNLKRLEALIKLSEDCGASQPDSIAAAKTEANEIRDFAISKLTRAKTMIEEIEI